MIQFLWFSIGMLVGLTIGAICLLWELRRWNLRIK